MRKNKKAVILLSGGLDSAVALYYAIRRGYRLTALIFDYSQRHAKEIQAAKRICATVKAPYYLIKTSLPWARSSLTDLKIKVPLQRDLAEKDIPPTYVPGRNIIFLSYAFSLAESIGAKKIFIGAHVQDYSGYPDCRSGFLKAFETAARKGLKKNGIAIEAPLIHNSKKDIVKLGLALKVPFEHTWSCYSGGTLPCRKCDSCRFRAAAFEALGRVDPLLENAKF